MFHKILQKIIYFLSNLDSIATINNGMSDKEILEDKQKYTQLNTDSRFAIHSRNDYICKFDKYANNGEVENGYFIQDIWGARKIFENKPDTHHDVGSSVQGFIAHLLAMKQKTILIDIRPMRNTMDTPFLNMGGGVKYIQSDATMLENFDDNSIESLSALCSIEHFGLGRYGDPIDPSAWQKALHSFQRVLKTGGRLYISVPVGQKDKVCFNAHRVYHPQTIIDTLNQMQIIEMSYIEGMDTKTCIYYDFETKKLKINQENMKNIPEYSKGGNTGLFEFVKL